MAQWLTANGGTLLVALVVAALFGAACFKLWKDHRAGKHSCSCGGGCGGCPNSAACCANRQSGRSAAP